MTVHSSPGYYLTKFERKKRLQVRATELGIPGAWQIAGILEDLVDKVLRQDALMGEMEKRIRKLEADVSAAHRTLDYMEDAANRQIARRADENHQLRQIAEQERWRLEDRISDLERELHNANRGW